MCIDVFGKVFPDLNVVVNFHQVVFHVFFPALVKKKVGEKVVVRSMNCCKLRLMTEINGLVNKISDKQKHDIDELTVFPLEHSLYTVLSGGAVERKEFLVQTKMKS